MRGLALPSFGMLRLITCRPPRLPRILRPPDTWAPGPLVPIPVDPWPPGAGSPETPLDSTFAPTSTVSQKNQAIKILAQPLPARPTSAGYVRDGRGVRRAPTANRNSPAAVERPGVGRSASPHAPAGRSPLVENGGHSRTRKLAGAAGQDHPPSGELVAAARVEALAHQPRSLDARGDDADQRFRRVDMAVFLFATSAGRRSSRSSSRGNRAAEQAFIARHVRARSRAQATSLVTWAADRHRIGKIRLPRKTPDRVPPPMSMTVTPDPSSSTRRANRRHKG